MTAPKNADNVRPFFDNGIEEDPKSHWVDEWTFEKAARLCRRMDLSMETFLKLIRDNRANVEVYDVGEKNVRYKTLDVIRLMRRRH